MKPLCILGAGGHGAVVADAALLSGSWNSVEFFDDRWPDEQSAHGSRIVGTSTVLRERISAGPANSYDVIVAVGDNIRRLELCLQLQAAGARLATVVHPSAVISPTAHIGAGTVVLAGTVVNPYSRTGVACIVNTRASIDHHCSLGDGVHICPGVALAGNVTVDDCAWIGIGACVIQGVVVGRAAVVGAGAAVIANVREGTTVVGCPAREIERA